MAQKYGFMANGAVAEVVPCLVCDEEKPRYSWTDLHGEGYCTRCGTPYQLIRDGKKITPKCNIPPDYIPALRSYWAETQTTNGLGTFMEWTDYPDQRDGRRKFNAWFDAYQWKKSGNPS